MNVELKDVSRPCGYYMKGFLKDVSQPCGYYMKGFLKDVSKPCSYSMNVELKDVSRPCSYSMNRVLKDVSKFCKTCKGNNKNYFYFYLIFPIRHLHPLYGYNKEKKETKLCFTLFIYFQNEKLKLLCYSLKRSKLFCAILQIRLPNLNDRTLTRF